MQISTPLIDFFETYYSPRLLRSKSPHSIRLHRIAIRTFARFLLRPATLADFDDDRVCGLLQWQTERGRSPYTVAKTRAVLLAQWRAACRKGWLTVWPDVAPETLPQRVPQAWTEDQVATLFTALRTLSGVVSGIPADAWWTALHYVLWDTGERIGPLLAVEWVDVDLTTGHIIMRAEHRKGRKLDRCYSLADDTQAALKMIRGAGNLVFPWPWSQSTLYNHYRRILKSAGLPHDRKSKFHRMRKSVASHAEAAGGNATEILGHSARRVTECYLDPRIVKGEKAVDFLWRPAG